METVAIYARYSSHSQTEASIEGQLAVCHEYAERNNLKVVHEYIDRALTGTSDKRPEFQQMISDSDRKMFNYVLVYQLDRFARDRYDSATYKHKLKKNGVRVISAKENITGDASGILMESVLEGMAEYYSAELAQKIKRGMNLNAQRCKFNGGRGTFGYSIDEEKNYVINPSQAEWVRRIFDMYINRTSITEICKYLNDHDVKTTTNSKWEYDAIRKVLENEKYIGNFRQKEIFVRGGIPRIVSDETFDMAQEIFKSKKTRKRTLLMEYPLTGKLYCAECGRPLIGDSGKNKKGYIYRYYTCIDKKKKRKCSLPSINKRVVEEVVTEIVKPLFNDSFIERIVDDALTNFSETHKAEEFANKLEAELNEVKEQIKKYTDLLIQSRNIDIIMDKIDELKAKEKEVSDKYYEEKSKVVKVDRNALIKKIKRIRDFDFTNSNALQKFLDLFVYRIYVNKDKKIAVLFKLSDGNISTEVSDNNNLVELTRIELATS